MIKINLGEEELKVLLAGNIVKTNDYEVILTDIGSLKIVELAITSWARYVAKLEDEDQKTLAIIKFDRAMKKLAELK